MSDDFGQPMTPDELEATRDLPGFIRIARLNYHQARKEAIAAGTFHVEPTPRLTERVYAVIDPAYLQTEPIRLWPFDAAPIELQAYSDNGGDEDWLAFVPKDLPLPIEPAFLMSMARYVKQYTTEYGDTVYIGSHS